MRKYWPCTLSFSEEECMRENNKALTMVGLEDKVGENISELIWYIRK
jgi:hypothetical protein